MAQRLLLLPQGERACIDLGQSAVSEPVMKRLKVSREGIVLIKSFEGFRPRAIRREDGSWIIGYGHTLSAREGASVSEADAELLLQYDLLPVAEAVNATVGQTVNQHQFDALASFAFSVGVDKFQSSDVLERIRAGFSTEAADAMVGWPETTAPEAALRRRAAERALFVADPASPVSLADLLAAPLPPPPVPEPAQDARSEDGAPAAVEAPPLDARSAAVAHLLAAPAILRGTATEVDVEPEPVQPAPLSTEPVSTEPVSTESAPSEDATQTAEAIGEAADDPAAFAYSAAAPEPVTPQADLDANPAISFPPIAFQRYAPYGAPMVGPLPGVAPPAAAEPVAPEEPSTTVIDFAAGRAAAEDAFPGPNTPETPEPTALDHGIQAATPEALPTPSFIEQPFAATRTDAAPRVEPLVLTPSSETSYGASSRLVWPEEQRNAEATGQSPLFDEDAILHETLGHVMRPDLIGPAAVDRFSWGEAGAYLLMGGFGLVSFGMSMAAVRLASQQSSGSGDTTLIAGVLFVIGVTCVGVSTYNLYRRWGRSTEG